MLSASWLEHTGGDTHSRIRSLRHGGASLHLLGSGGLGRRAVHEKQRRTQPDCTRGILAQSQHQLPAYHLQHTMLTLALPRTGPGWGTVRGGRASLSDQEGALRCHLRQRGKHRGRHSAQGMVHTESMQRAVPHERPPQQVWQVRQRRKVRPPDARRPPAKREGNASVAGCKSGKGGNTLEDAGGTEKNGQCR